MKSPFAFMILTALLALALCLEAQAQNCYINSAGQMVCSRSYATPIRNVVGTVRYAQPVRRVFTRLQANRPILRPFARSYYFSTPSTASYGSSGTTMSYGSSGTTTTYSNPESYSEAPESPSSASETPPAPPTTSSSGCDCGDRWDALEDRLESIERKISLRSFPSPPTGQRAIKDPSLLAALESLTDPSLLASLHHTPSVATHSRQVAKR